MSKNISKIIKAAAVAAVATTAVLGAFSATASAAPSCAQICVYENTNFGGNSLALNNLSGVSWGAQYWWNDKVSSIVNNTDNAVCFFSDIWWKGQTFQIHGHESWSSIGYMNDKISSIQVGNCPS
ncbi:peptidase inhibitor family I36 protein [Streptomyces sp. NPDC046984]|uniref:peptidase inhibitor family I36 protein n=1 Tax=Streptomyces sp. NPDC046984 TaxID=3155138 RepID=UPI0033D9F9A4